MYNHSKACLPPVFHAKSVKTLWPESISMLHCNRYDILCHQVQDRMTYLTFYVAEAILDQENTTCGMVLWISFVTLLLLLNSVNQVHKSNLNHEYLMSSLVPSVCIQAMLYWIWNTDVASESPRWCWPLLLHVLLLLFFLYSSFSPKQNMFSAPVLSLYLKPITPKTDMYVFIQKSTYSCCQIKSLKLHHSAWERYTLQSNIKVLCFPNQH